MINKHRLNFNPKVTLFQRYFFYSGSHFMARARNLQSNTVINIRIVFVI